MKKLLNSELGRKSIEEFRSSEKNGLIVVLDQVRSLNNIGSIFRTSDAFLVEAIYLCGITATPPHKDIQKTALGATESVVWKYFDNTIDAIKLLKENNYTIISIEQVEKSINLQNFEVGTNEKYALIFGNEVNGVTQEIVEQSDYCIEIPQFGTKHSFNISVSAGIVLWEFFKQLQKK